MAVWFSPNHGTAFLDVGTVFWDSLRAEFEDCFMVEFIAVNDSLEIFFKRKTLKFLDRVQIISKAGYWQIYGWEWLVCVDYFCVLLL